MSTNDFDSISPRDLHEFCRDGNDIELIDVRPRPMFDQCHVPEARFVDFDSLDPNAIMQSRGLAAGDPLYVICQKGVRSVKVCERLTKAGIANVINVEGGTGAWVEASLPVVIKQKSPGRLPKIW